MTGVPVPQPGELHDEHHDEPTGGWFGYPWDAPVCEDETAHLPTPVGAACTNCEQPIGSEDQGLTYPHVFALGEWRLAHTHVGCFRRLLGGLTARLTGALAEERAEW
jgi:hypothetical protein